MQLQLALLLSQISMPIFRRVCRTFVFIGRLFLVSSLFTLFVYLLVCLWRESKWSAANLGSLPRIARSRNNNNNNNNNNKNNY